MAAFGQLATAWARREQDGLLKSHIARTPLRTGGTKKGSDVHHPAVYQLPRGQVCSGDCATVHYALAIALVCSVVSLRGTHMLLTVRSLLSKI